jgi:dTDP-4-amino-4,6-dideoxygalactose transaminase
MLEMQAVIGRIQLRRMADWAAARKRNAEVIWSACREFAALRVPQIKCASCPGTCQSDGANCEHAHYKCYVYVQPERLASGWSRDRIVDAINAQSVPCYQGSCSEVYLEKAFDDTGWRPTARLSAAKALGETSLMFLVHPTLKEEEIAKTCLAIRMVMNQANSLSI